MARGEGRGCGPSPLERVLAGWLDGAATLPAVASFGRAPDPAVGQQMRRTLGIRAFLKFPADSPEHPLLPLPPPSPSSSVSTLSAH